MGIIDHLFDSEYKQRRDLIDLQASSSGTSDAVVQLRSDLTSLRHRLDRAELAAEAMYRLLQDKGLVNADELRTWIARVDLEDGAEDGTLGADQSARAAKCPACARPANLRHRTHCVFCGAPYQPEPAAAPYR